MDHKKQIIYEMKKVCTCIVKYDYKRQKECVYLEGGVHSKGEIITDIQYNNVDFFHHHRTATPTTKFKKRTEGQEMVRLKGSPRPPLSPSTRILSKT